MVVWFWALLRAVHRLVWSVFAVLVAIHEMQEIQHYSSAFGFPLLLGLAWSRIQAVNEVQWAYIISLVVFLAIFLVFVRERPRQKMKKEFEQDLSDRLETKDDDNEHH
jgi:hypothetical protein